MVDLELLVLIAGAFLIPFFSVLAARREWELWQACRRAEDRRRMQRQITMGKSHCR